MRLKLCILTVAVVLGSNIMLCAQELNLGVKFGGGISKTGFTPATFHFSTVTNETAYISEITSEKLYTGLILNLDYHSKNRWGAYADLFTQTMSYDFRAFSNDVDYSLINSEVKMSPLLSTTHLTTALGFSFDIIQT